MIPIIVRLGSDEPCHIFCCNVRMALCGASLDEDEEIFDEDYDENICLICSAIEEEGVPCTSANCKYRENSN